VVTFESGSSAYDPAKRASAGRSFTIPPSRLRSILDHPKTPCLNALLAQAGQSFQQTQATEAECAAFDIERREQIEAMIARANGEGWSQRELARRSGLSWGGWRRILSGTADLSLWMPRLREAANRLQEQPA
jgi:hypothetical protein